MKKTKTQRIEIKKVETQRASFGFQPNIFLLTNFTTVKLSSCY